jgi:hypothetical protein
VSGRKRLTGCSRFAIAPLAIACSFAAIATAQTDTAGGNEVRTATVRIVPVHVNGMKLEGDFKIDFFQEQNGKTDLASKFRNGAADGIPYGTYRARVHLPGFWSAERTVQVYQPDVLAVVGLQIGTEGGPQMSDIKGRVDGADPSAGPVRIRMLGVYSDDIRDVESNASGAFIFFGAPAGDYVLIATQGHKILGLEPIRLPLKNSSVVINVANFPRGANF